MPAFVGRKEELATLSTAVEQSRAGRGGNLVVVEGDAGIGKTRLCEELEAFAVTRGVDVAWGRSHEHSGAPPYWPWTQLLRAVLSSRAGRAPSAQEQAHSSRVARHLPGLAGLLPGSESPPAPDEQEEYLLRDSICELVCGLASQRPLLLILEDIHWADAGAIAALRDLPERPGAAWLTAVATTRVVGSDPAYASAGTLRRATNGIWVRLEGLPRTDTRTLFQSAVAQVVSERKVEAVIDLAEGNPFFVTELAGSWAQLDASLVSGLPASAVEVVSSRLAGVPREAIRALELASAIGREFNVEKLIPVEGSGGMDALSSALEIGRGRRIVEELGGPGDFRFIHEITRQVLYRGVQPLRRAEMHGRIARALELHYGVSASEHAAELSFHWRNAGPSGDPAQRARWALAAGQNALDLFASTTAVEEFSDALAAAESVADPDSVAAAREGLGRSLSDLFKIEDAVENLRMAFEHWMSRGDVTGAVRTAGNYVPGLDGMRGMAPIQKAALELHGVDEAARARLMVILARSEIVAMGDTEPGIRRLEEALSIARRLGDRALECYIAGHGVQTAGFQRRFEDCRYFANTTIALAPEVNDPFSLSTAFATLAFLEMYEGRIDEADALIARARDQVAELRIVHRASSAVEFELRVAVQTCRWDLGRAAFQRARGAGHVDSRVLGLAIAIEYMTGNVTAGDGLLEEFMALPEPERNRTEIPAAHFFPLVARGSLSPDHATITRAAADLAVGSPSLWIQSVGWLALGWLAVERRDAVTASAIRDRLLEFNLQEPERAVLPALAHVLGLVDEAAAEFERLIPLCDARRLHLDCAWLRYDYANLLSEHPEVRPALVPAALIAEGREYALRYGLKPLARRFERLSDRAAPAGPSHGLSAREVEVLRLLAHGRTNKEIAAELVISPATVNRHVTNIFTKLDVNNRAQATDFAHRLGLVS